jgi:hypothetical protein
VLRTNALSLGIAPAGVTVDGATGTSVNTTDPTLTNGPQGTQSFVTGTSGGQANLFGNIPGKGHSIDVTVSLATKINSIIRIVDQDVFDTPLIATQAWPAGIFNCRQVWTGAVQNYIPGVRLTGQLRIAPAITKDGKLRIAKATVQTPDETRVALSACLMPHRSYGADAAPGFPETLNRRPDPDGPGPLPAIPAAGGLTPALPTFTEASTGGFAPGLVGGVPNVVSYASTALPFVNSASAAPSSVPCNSTPTQLVRNSGLTGAVNPQVPANVANGYTTTYNGSQATVGGDITVPGLEVDVLIGDN